MSHLTAKGHRSFLTKLIGDDLEIHLFWNLPTAANLASEKLTAFDEVRGFGYAPVPVRAHEWGITAHEAKLKEQVFMFAGPLPKSVWGYYVTKDDGSTLVFSDVFPSPRSIDMEGDSIGITIALKLDTLVEPTRLIEG